MQDDPTLKLSLSLYQSPGVYALLIGSGVSKAAGVPTGWDIILDLIRRVAVCKGEKPDPDPESWYRRKFKEPPNYSKLLEMLTKTPSERMRLLRPYFEPAEEEREKGLKVPTPAHRAIAQLVKRGHIRMILTTNFDRLTETALGERELCLISLPIIILRERCRTSIPDVSSLNFMEITLTRVLRIPRRNYLSTQGLSIAF
jgi:hypothetical protein